MNFVLKHIGYFGLAALSAALLLFLPGSVHAAEPVSAGDEEPLAAGKSDSEPRKYKIFTGCSGGMMVHTGWVSGAETVFTRPDGSSTSPMRMSGAPFGIGGAAKVHLWNYLRVGTEGYVSHLNYDRNGSNESVGWGGFLVEGMLPLGRWFPFAGVTVGGGSVKNVTVLEPTISDFLLDNGTTSYRKYSFMALTPYIGVEFALTTKVHIVLKADCLLDLSSRQSDFPLGPRLYLGFMFWH